MANVLIAHGIGGYPEENWFPWLKGKLEEEGNQVFVPQFPTPEKQTLEAWMKVLEEYRNKINEESILVGHSLGAPFVLRIIEQTKVRAAFLVSGYLENPDEPATKSFTDDPFDWEAIKGNCSSLHVFHSDNDPYIPLEQGRALAEKLGVGLNLVPGAGHFNTAAGYNEFELLLKKIRKELGLA